MTASGTHSLTRSRWAAIGAAIAITLGGGGLIGVSASGTESTLSYERLGMKALKRRGANLGGSGSRDRFDGYTESWSSEALKLSSLRQLIEWVRDDEF